MSGSRPIALGVFLSLACVPPKAGTSEADASTSSGPGSTDSGDETTSTTGAPTTSTSTQAFPDFAGPVKECDPWQQDCPEGQKCMPFSGDGDNAWESLKCVDVVPDPDGLYEDCTVFGSPVSGEDSCDTGMMCWDVVDGTGTCVAMCTGSIDWPGCADPNASCYVDSSGVITLCFPLCHPLAPNCRPTELCVPKPYDPSWFACVPDASGDEGQVFDPCEAADACDPGLLCVNPAIAGECDPMAIGCCVPFCDTTLQPDDCPGQGLECLPWYEPGMAPPGHENVGVCGLPGD